jgi:phosphopantetheine adenylyltransferase
LCTIKVVRDFLLALDLKNNSSQEFVVLLHLDFGITTSSQSVDTIVMGRECEKNENE